MTFLPIVDRELRVAARRRSTYWTRTLVALGAIVIGCVLYGANLFASPQQVGQYIFTGLSGLCLLHALASGRRLTADCLSEEKREGTLGLLFLTDLKGHDIVLGKLAATSLSGFYGLLAILPVLAIPLLMGGISNEEFWRMALVLVDAFLFSLAVGIFASAVSRDARRALGSNFLLLLLLMAALPAGAAAIMFSSPSHRYIPELLYPCPVYTFVLSFDVHYATAPDHFWWSAGVIHGLTWLLVGLASWAVPYSWQDKPALPRAERSRWREVWHALSFGRAAKRGPFRKQLLNVNAFYWLASRARLKPVHVWTFLLLATGWWSLGWLANGRLWLDESVCIAAALILNSTLKLWVAVEAGQQLAEDRKMGALELLLSTRLSVRDILRGQFLALRRQFLGPMIAVVAIELLLMVMAWWQTNSWRASAFCLASLIMLLADFIALGWVAMHAALTAKNPQHATVVTVGRVLVMPWLVFGIGAALANSWAALTSPTGATLSWKFNLSLWLTVGIIADVLYVWLARQRLLSGFRSLALQRYAPASSPSLVARWTARLRAHKVDREIKRRAAASAPLQGRQAPGFLKRRKAVLGGILVLVAASLILASFRSRPGFPPPIVVSLGQSNAPLRAFPGVSGALLILPDGSLWRWGLDARGLPPGVRIVPERVGTDADWIDAGGHYHCVGIRRDGTLWEWGQRPDNSFSREPVQVGSGSNWTRASAGFGYSMALRRDGTLWAWGNNQMNQLGNGPGSNQPKPVQVGADRDWTDVRCQFTSTIGLRSNGTLWAWGDFYVTRAISPNVIRLPVPTQLCQETNWAGLGDGLWGQAWTRSGELWGEFSGTPNAEAPAAAIARRILSVAAPGRVAFSFTGVPELYEVRTNGTLWKRTDPYGPGMSVAVGEWRQVGKRADWISVWGSGTAIGLTADGTVWTWGLDPSRPLVPSFSSRLKLFEARILSLFGKRPPPVVSGTQPAHQKEPRPLLKLVPANSVPARGANPTVP